MSDDKSEIINISGKGTLNPNIYIGVCGVKDYKKFWEALHSKEAIQAGEVFGLRALKDIKPIEIYEWYDCGSLEYLNLAKENLRVKSIIFLKRKMKQYGFQKMKLLNFLLMKISFQID